ncbi:MAG TPA: AbrB/MazE/SpoVT family DNA-binding domain-containing protein [Thermoanaerobaculia bacterium]|nr:AbrB/MazE/SpoVT family DNA-binding domain-containing protein [Thermoanaerobaculia bacterium]
MKTTMDAAGRVVIPKPLRERLGLSGGEILELREREGRIELEPAATSMALAKTKGGLAAVPERRLPPLTDEVVRDTLERSRR